MIFIWTYLNRTSAKRLRYVKVRIRFEKLFAIKQHFSFLLRKIKKTSLQKLYKALKEIEGGWSRQTIAHWFSQRKQFSKKLKRIKRRIYGQTDTTLNRLCNSNQFWYLQMQSARDIKVKITWWPTSFRWMAGLLEKTFKFSLKMSSELRFWMLKLRNESFVCWKSHLEWDFHSFFVSLI